jgi:predicted nuclease of restriction endonuclease-like (RecB) superfamily
MKRAVAKAVEKRLDYGRLVESITQLHGRTQAGAAAAVNRYLVLRNWLTGAYIVEFEQRGTDRARYGQRLLDRLSADLVQRGIRGLSATSLRQSRQFYRLYPNIRQTLSDESQQLRSQIHQTASDESPRTMRAVGKFAATSSLDLPPISATLSRKSRVQQPTPMSPELLLRLAWSHFIELIRLEDPWKRAFYENECLHGQWSVRQLQRQIGSLLFERTGLSKDKAAVIRRANRQESAAPVGDLLRDPYVLEFTGLGEREEYTESDLGSALLDHLQQFLLELGTGFCFEARQKRITVGNKHNYIDLVFYQRRLRCHVLIDMKTRPFTHGDAGQMNFYLNWWKKNGMERGDSPPVGIILCSDREKTEVEFATAGMDNKLFVSRYLVALPSAKQLQEFIERDREQIEMQTRRGR